MAPKGLDTTCNMYKEMDSMIVSEWKMKQRIISATEVLILWMTIWRRIW